MIDLSKFPFKDKAFAISVIDMVEVVFLFAADFDL
jgi:hypothetical protein